MRLRFGTCRGCGASLVRVRDKWHNYAVSASGREVVGGAHRCGAMPRLIGRSPKPSTANGRVLDVAAGGVWGTLGSRRVR